MNVQQHNPIEFFIRCPYLAITIEYLVEIVFFLSTETTTHTKKCDPPSMAPCKQTCHGVNLSYVAKQNEKNVISIVQTLSIISC